MAEKRIREIVGKAAAAVTKPVRENRNPPALKPPLVIVSIVERGKSDRLSSAYKSSGVFFTLKTSGKGTASSEIMDILGLEDSRKDVLVSFASARDENRLMTHLGDSLRASYGVKGIAFSIKVGAATNMLVQALGKRAGGEVKTVEDKSKQYCLVAVSVREGYADEVMQTAKTAGVRGGTVIRAVQSDNVESERVLGTGFTPERDIILMVMDRDKRSAVMDAINAENGIRSEANAMVVALPVERLVKLG